MVEETLTCAGAIAMQVGEHRVEDMLGKTLEARPRRLLDLGVRVVLEHEEHGGQLDGLVARVDVPLDSSGATLAWSRYVGGNQLEQVRDVALNGNGQAFITGRMASPDFATTAGVLQPNYAGGGMDAFLARIDNDGSVGYASYFGGNSYDVGY